MKPTPSLAAIWLKDGHAAVSRSFRFHRPRGAYCHRGWCQQCKTRLPDGTVVLACTAVSHGHVGTAPSRRTDVLRVFGMLAERTRPWFFERQTLGGAFQQAFLRTLRWMSAALPLPGLRTQAARARTSKRSCQTLVIGGGPAGLLAADALARAGRSCLVVHAGEPGGSARRLFADQAPPWPAPSDAAPTFERLDRHLCVGLYDDAQRALCVGPDGNVLVSFDELVVATGAYDRIPTVEGNDTPGVIGLRAFERLAAQGAIPAGSQVGVYAGAGEGTRAAAAARAAGIALAFVASPDATALRRILGRDRVAGVAFEDGTTQDCDLLVVGFTQPSYEFQAQNGCTVELVGQPPVVRATGIGRRPMLVVGEASGWTDPDTLASTVGAAVQAWLAGESKVAPHVAAAESRRAPERPADGALVCLCEDVRVGDIRAAIADGYGDVELVKRHTGAGTGPCQGKLCHAALLSCMAEAGHEVRIPTPRPLLRPVPLRQLAGDGSLIRE